MFEVLTEQARRAMVLGQDEARRLHHTLLHDRDSVATRGNARILARLDQRLAAIERWVGMTPDVSDLDQQIVDAGLQNESSINRQAFDTAAALRDKEKELRDRKTGLEKEWADDHPPLAVELGRVNAELERLRELLRQHGIES